MSVYDLESPQFFGLKGVAANLSHDRGAYTPAMFADDFPQFRDADSGISFLPVQALDMFVNMANASIAPDKWLELWRYAAGLYVAHNATLYLRTFSTDARTAQAAAATGALSGVVTTAKMGDTSISYDIDALTKATEGWGDLNATTYGQMLATQARLVGMGGTLV